jgi:O-methyltransferase
MKDRLIDFLKRLGLHVSRFDEKKYKDRQDYFSHRQVYEKYMNHTMIPFHIYSDNLLLAKQTAGIKGDVVECGVWRGGMIAGIAETMGGGKKYWLCDSFEGLPPAGQADGTIAQKWQADKTGEHYYDNCAAEQSYAKEAMKMAGSPSHELVKGWFNETLQHLPVREISLLRLDGDWYESTLTCLEQLYPKVVDGGMIIIDDYYFWDGCTRAVHDFLSKNGLSDRIRETANGVAYMIKNQKVNHFS